MTRPHGVCGVLQRRYAHRGSNTGEEEKKGRQGVVAREGEQGDGGSDEKEGV